MKNLIFLLSIFFFQFANAQAPAFDWVAQIGGSSSDIGQAIATDASGNVYTIGNFQGTADFDPGTGVFNLSSASGGTVFISKLDKDGHFVWAKQVGGLSSAKPLAIAADAIGYIYITGYFNGTADFDPGAGVYNMTAGAQADIFILKLDTGGNFVWAKQFGGSQDDEGYSIAVDASGNVYTTGYFLGTVDFDPGNGTYDLTSDVYYDVFISKLDASGNFVWAKQMPANKHVYGYGIAVDGSNNVLITGLFTGTTDFDPGPGTYYLTPGNFGDIFVAKLNESGNFVWAKQFKSNVECEGHAIALDESGNIYTTGYFKGTTDFDPGAGTYNLTSAGAFDIFVSKLDESGNFVWASAMGGISNDYGYAIKVDAKGSVYTVGSFFETADFDPGPGIVNLTSAGATDIFISKLNSSGNFEWVRQVGGTLYDNCFSLAIDAASNLYLTGSFDGVVDFDPGSSVNTLSTKGGLDVFVLKLGQLTDGISASTKSNYSTVYPNPFHSVINLALPMPNDNEKIDIYNAEGKLIIEQTNVDELNSFDLYEEPSGLYFIRIIRNNTLVSSHTIIKQ